MIDADADGEGPRAATMGAARIARTSTSSSTPPRRSMDGQVSDEAALADYFPRLLEAYGGDASLIHTFEDVHLRYL